MTKEVRWLLKYNELMHSIEKNQITGTRASMTKKNEASTQQGQA